LVKLAIRHSWLNAGQKRNVRLVYAGVMNRHTKVLMLTYIHILYASSVNFGSELNVNYFTSHMYTADMASYIVTG